MRAVQVRELLRSWCPPSAGWAVLLRPQDVRGFHGSTGVRSRSFQQVDQDVERQPHQAQQDNPAVHALVGGHHPIVHDVIAQPVTSGIGLAHE